MQNTHTSAIALVGAPSNPRVASNATPIAVKPKAAAIMLDVSVSTLYELMNAGELKSYRDGASRKILVSSIHDYVERRMSGEPRAA